ncbi:MAG: 30S ribosomal protein S20 [Chitinophagales bacterium]|nr:30S ribosomal protein S20 [Chitinophagales bacterium]
MAHHKSAQKSIRQGAKRNARNRYYGKTTRNAIKGIRISTDKTEAEKQLPAAMSMLDKLAKRNVIHKNKAANLKSGLMKKISKM